MQERDQLVRRSRKRSFVNQLHAGALRLAKLIRNVICRKGDVMDALTTLFNVLRDRAVGSGRLKQLNVSASDIKEGRTHLLRWNLLDVFAFQSKRAFVIFNGIGERAHRYPKMIDSCDHDF